MIGIAALTGWLIGRMSLAGAVAGYTPVAPNAALCFITLGGALCAIGGAVPRARTVATAAGGIVALIAGARLLEYLAGIDFGVDRWFFSAPTQQLGLAPIGKMAFFASVTFLFASTAIVATAFARTGALSEDIARAFGALTAVIGAIFLLGYAYRSPLLYGGATIPLPFPTALGFLFLGVSVVALEQQHARAARRILDAAVQAIDDRFREAFAQSAIGFAYVGLDGRFLEVNDALCDLTGYSEATLLTKTFQDITHPDDLVLDLAERKRLADGEIPSYQMEKRFRHGAGRDVLVCLTASAMRAADGSVRHFLAQVEDITQRRAAEEARVERAHREALHQLAVGIRHEMNNAVSSLLLELELFASDEEIPIEFRVHAPSMLALCARLTNALQRLNHVEQLPVVQYLGGTLMRDISGATHAAGATDDLSPSAVADPLL